MKMRCFVTNEILQPLIFAYHQPSFLGKQTIWFSACRKDADSLCCGRLPPKSCPRAGSTSLMISSSLCLLHGETCLVHLSLNACSIISGCFFWTQTPQIYMCVLESVIPAVQAM